MKKILALVLAMALSLVACGSQGATNSDAPGSSAPVESTPPAGDTPPAEENPDEAVEITLWTCPIGKWGNEADVKVLTDAFTAETGIKVTALGNVDQSLVEAAEVDGATRLQVFWRIKWPQMMPTTLYILVITTINSFQCFALIQLLTSGGSGTNTVMYYIYHTAFKLTEQAGHFGYANAMGVVLAIFIGALSALQCRLAKEN